MSNDQSPTPGWYPAPHANNEQRYWDGTRWLEPQPPADPLPAASPTTTVDAEHGSPAPQAQPPKPSDKKEFNLLGLIALIVAGIGFIFACIPGALIAGWVLLPIGFILAIVSLFLNGKGKGFAIAALIVAIVGTVVGFVVFFAVVSDAFDDSFGTGDTTAITEPSDPPTDEQTDEQPAAAVEGTRETPYPLGTTVSNDEWEVTVNTVTFGATDAVIAENQFNEPPADGNEYILVNATVTYVGDDEEGGTPAFVTIEYVTSTGETVENTYAVAPESLDSLSTLYNGGTATGNIAIEVPSDGANTGVLAVSPGIIADTVFFAVQ